MNTAAETNERVERLIELALKYEITGYEVAKNTNKKITEPTFRNFIERKRIPYSATLDVIEKYITNKYLNNDHSYQVNEEQEKYGDSKTEFSQIMSMLETISLKQDIIFEIMKNSSKAVADVVAKEKTL